MFKMTVIDAIKVHDNLISVAGPCTNRADFSNRLVDNYGNAYDAHIPFDKTLIHNDSEIVLGIYGSYDIEVLIGRELVNG